MSRFGRDDTVYSGDLDRWIEILAPATGSGPWGGPVGDPVSFTKCWANYRSMRYTHTAGAGAEFTSSTDVFTIRYREDITPNMSVLWKGHLYEIDRIAEVGRRVGLELHCRTVK